MAYLLDADVFIRAKNLHYGFDFCPAFWDWLIAEHRAGNVYSVEKVGDELQAVADELSAWATKLDEGFFLRPDASVFPALATVSGWVQSQQYTQSAVSTLPTTMSSPRHTPADTRLSRTKFRRPPRAGSRSRTRVSDSASSV